MNGGTEIKASGTKTLRPRVIKHCVFRDFPAQVRATAEARIGSVEMLGGQIVAERNIARTRRRAIGVTTEAACRISLRHRVDGVVASSDGQRQRSWNDVDGAGSEDGLLCISFGDVVEEGIVVVAYSGIDGAHAGRRRGIGETGRGLEFPIGIFIYLVVLPEEPHDAAQSPLVRRAQPQLLAVVSVLFHIMPSGTRRVTLTGFAGLRRRGALVIVGIEAAGIVRIVLDLLDVA